LPVPQNNNEPRKQNTKKPKKQKQQKKQDCTPQGEGVRCSLLLFFFVSCFFCFLVPFFVFVNRKETAKVRLQRANKPIAGA
jgi:hypothetical protein